MTMAFKTCFPLSVAALLLLFIAHGTGWGQTKSSEYHEKKFGDSTKAPSFTQPTEPDETLFTGFRGQDNIITTLRSGFLHNLKQNYRAMPGVHYSHAIEDDDIYSGKWVYELRDDREIPIWFARYIHKEVCATGSCKMVRIWLFWDGAGEYLGTQIVPEDPLTKQDHVEFDPEDYTKLDEILKDTASILREYSYDGLSKVLEEPGEQAIDPTVDAISGATPPSLATAVVKDAVYTCHTLWHTVYGATRSFIHKKLNERVDMPFIEKFFDSGNPSYQSWAIGKAKENTKFGKHQYVIDLIGHNNTYLSKKAIDYFDPETLHPDEVKRALVAKIPSLNQSDQNLVLWKLSKTAGMPTEITISLLDLFLENRLGKGALVLIYNLVRPNDLEDDKLIAQLTKISASGNAYWHSLTEKLLQKKGNHP